jgi:hypothetical protein
MGKALSEKLISLRGYNKLLTGFGALIVAWYARRWVIISSFSTSII